MKKYIVLLLFIFGMLMAGCSDDRSYTIDEVTIDATINDDGSINVRELFTYTFSGEHNGTTRSIRSDEQNFKAYEAQDTTDVTDSTDTLERLKTEYDSDDNMYEISTASEDETKRVLYSYEVNGSVKKYSDVGTMLYTFFDEANETDLHDVSITIHPPSNTMSGETYAFLHHSDFDNLQETNDGIHYETDLLPKGDSTPIRYIFPSEELSKQNLTEESAMKEELLEEEHELVERYENLDKNMSRIKPFIWAAFPLILIVFIIFYGKHPSAYEKIDPEKAQALLETSDPLFVKILFGNESAYKTRIPEESLIAALFSLRRRGFITIEKETKETTETNQNNHADETFRFTWVKEAAEVDGADYYLKKWLFTNHDEKGSYFYLEDLTYQEDEDSKTQKEKATWFVVGLKEWKDHLWKRDDYQNMKQPFHAYSIVSFALIIITYALFSYFIQIDTLSQTLRWVLPLVLGSVAALSIMIKYRRLASFAFHFLTLVSLLIWFTKTSATIWGMILIGFILFLISTLPPHYWKKPIREVKSAIIKAEQMFNKGTYPISEDPDVNEMRLEYAILLKKGKKFGNRFEEEKLPKDMINYPLLVNPAFAEFSLSARSINLNTYSGGGRGSSGGGGVKE